MTHDPLEPDAGKLARPVLRGGSQRQRGSLTRLSPSTIDPHETVQRSDEKRSHVVESPPLENGDRLTREEFERRYEAMPHVKKAELIDGVVYLGSPVRFGRHSEPHAALLTWLGTYAAFTQGVRLGDNAPFVWIRMPNRSRTLCCA
jgi:hypothetical protein